MSDLAGNWSVEAFLRISCRTTNEHTQIAFYIIFIISLFLNFSLSMQLLVSPLLMTNLACEMLFVIHQRLHAQNVNEVKSRRVLHDIVNGFVDPSFLRELFTPQPLCTATAAKEIFQKLAHMSIMKLNEAR